MTALNGLSLAADERGALTLAQDYGRQALALARELGTQPDIALYLINLADGDIQLGDIATARRELQEGLALAQRLGALRLVVLAVMNFGELAYAEGQTKWALALMGLARRQPMWSIFAKQFLDAALAEWGLDSSAAEAGMAKGAELDWDKTIEELLKR